MTPENFCYWLQGFSELNGQVPTEDQWKSITEHLGLVFKKVTPSGPGQVYRQPKLSDLDNRSHNPLPVGGPLERAIYSSQNPTVEITCVATADEELAKKLSRAALQASTEC